MPRLHLAPEKNSVAIVQEAGWASGPVWTGAENLAPTGIRSPDCPARRQSLYRLRYTAHRYSFIITEFHVAGMHTKFCSSYPHHMKG
jgi:hypothetical protein